jgi:hypothetical protein
LPVPSGDVDTWHAIVGGAVVLMFNVRSAPAYRKNGCRRRKIERSKTEFATSSFTDVTLLVTGECRCLIS